MTMKKNETLGDLEAWKEGYSEGFDAGYLAARRDLAPETIPDDRKEPIDG